MEKQYSCFKCGKTCASQASLSQHSLTHYDYKERDYECLFSGCHKRFRRGQDLARHKLTHTGEKPAVCPICDQQFDRQSHLTEHMRCHTGERPYKCPTCDKAFKQKTNLNAHIRTHSGERPYICPACGHQSRRSNSLAVHMKIHLPDDGAVLKCPTCGKEYSSKSVLTRHRRDKQH